jgi:copper transporter 1
MNLASQMLFTWDTTNLCIVFPSWRITGTLSLIVSLLAVVALTAGYEAIREISRRYEERLETNVREAPRKFFFHPHPLLSPEISRTYLQGLVCGMILLKKKPCLRIHFYAHSKDDVERSSLLTTMAGNAVAAEEKKGKTVKAALYGLQVFYSFFIM